MALDLLNATDHFLGEAAMTARDRKLALLRQRLDRDMQNAFYQQGDLFVSKLQPTLPGWEGLFDDAAAATESAFVDPIVRTVKAALTIGGDAMWRAMQIQGAFDLANPLAVRYVSEHGAELVAGVNQTTKDYIRTVIQQGVDEGWSPDRMAKAITDRYEEFAVGKPQQHIDSRAHGIAVTETGNAYEAGNRIVAKDLAGVGLDMEKSWLTAGDDRVCSELCEANEAQGWIPLDEPFSSGDMQPLAHPYCVLGDSVVAVSGLSAAAQSLYRGEVVEISCGHGSKLTVTENHPILTAHGWVAAQFIREGDDVITCANVEGMASSIQPDYDHTPSMAEQVFRALKESRGMASARVPVAAEDLHGDGRSVYGYVNIVYPDGSLLSEIESRLAQLVSEHILSRENTDTATFTGLRDALPGLCAGFLSSDGSVGVGGQVQALLWGEALHSQGISLADPANDHARFQQETPDGGARDTELLRQFLLRYAGEIGSDNVVSVRKRYFVGHVYDLQSEIYGLYTCNGILVKNCRCAALYRRKVTDRR